ncbi:DUF3500 domain-containing protein [Negadavirga shengliensis]
MWLLLFTPFTAIGQDLSEQASHFLSTLTDDLKKSAAFPFDHSERFNWHFIPRDRKGPTFHDFNEEQKEAAINLMKASLGKQGFEKATAIFELENVLRDIENRPKNDTYRDPLNYHFTIFGQPSSEKEWGWRLEGHHLSLNFSSGRGTIISSTPTFYGSNPAIVPSGIHKGKQVLEQETKLGFELLRSLDKNQLAKAKFSDEAPSDIITGNDREASILEPRGIFYHELTPQQQAVFRKLLDVYLGHYTAEFAHKMMEDIQKNGLEELSFAWAGSQQNQLGHPHYYRIQGPTFIIEYDNVQNNANHVHTVIRDLSNDFATDVLRQHYLHGHAHQ